MEEKPTLYCINESLTLDGRFSAALFCASNSAINLAFMQVFWDFSGGRFKQQVVLR